jgi:hypothetical protein
MKIVKTFESRSTIKSAPAPAKRIGKDGTWSGVAWGKLQHYPYQTGDLPETDPRYNKAETFGYFFSVGRLVLRWYSI